MKRQLHSVLLTNYLCPLLISAFGIVLIPGNASATSYKDTVVDNAAIVIDTALFNLTAREEKELIGRNWDEYNRQRKQEGKVSVGQVGINGFYPVYNYGLSDLDSTVVLTYFFIDSSTGLLTTPAFDVAAVRYEGLLEPPTLDKSQLTWDLILENLVPLGTSTDLASNFALDFTLRGFEPIILGFPMDEAGNEITGEGTAGFGSTVLVREPPTLLLFGMGAFVALVYFHRRWKHWA